MARHSELRGSSCFHRWKPHVISVAVMLASCQAVMAASEAAIAQPGDLACKYYNARCQAGLKSPLCTQLQQRCEAATGKAGPNPSRAAGASGQGALDNLLTMPDCGPGEEVVMVPTCLCDTAPDQGGAAAGDSECASCSSDGVRLACQKQP